MAVTFIQIIIYCLTLLKFKSSLVTLQKKNNIYLLLFFNISTKVRTAFHSHFSNSNFLTNISKSNVGYENTMRFNYRKNGKKDGEIQQITYIICDSNWFPLAFFVSRINLFILRIYSHLIYYSSFLQIENERHYYSHIIVVVLIQN